MEDKKIICPDCSAEIEVPADAVTAECGECGKVIDLSAAETAEAAAETEETAEAEEVAEAEEAAEITQETETEPEEDTEEAEDEGEEEEEQRICEYCGSGYVAHGHEFCYSCEAKLRRTKIPLAAWITGALALSLSVFAFVVVCLLAAPALQTVKGDIKAKENNWFSAYEEYSAIQTVLDQINEITEGNRAFAPFLKTGCAIEGKIFEAAEHVYDPIQAYSFAAKVFTINDKYKDHCKAYKDCAEKYAEYESTYSKLTEIMADLYKEDGSTPGLEDGKKAIAAMEEYRGRDDLSQVWLEYFMYNTAGLCGFTEEEKVACLDRVDEAAKKSGKDYSWLYYEDYVKCLVNTGREDEAAPLMDALLEADKSNFKAAASKLKMLFKQGDMKGAEEFIDKFCADNMTTDGDNSDSNYSAMIMLARAQGNYEQALALIDEADEMYAMIPEFDRQKALIYLAQGDYDKAFDSAVSAEDRAYSRYYYYGDSTGYNSELLATVYLSAMLCRQKGQGKAENFSKLDEIIESYKGTDSEKAMADVLSGKVSLEKLLTEGVYDLI